MLLCIVYQGAAEFRILFYAIHEAEVKRLHAVSYTHLDVYKRQVRSELNTEGKRNQRG